MSKCFCLLGHSHHATLCLPSQMHSRVFLVEPHCSPILLTSKSLGLLAVQEPRDSAQYQGRTQPLVRHPELNKSGHAGGNLAVQKESFSILLDSW